MSDGHILVTFAEIEGARADTAATYAALNTELDDLKAYLRPLVASWTGQAAANYSAMQAQWDTAAQDLNMILNTISAALATANDNYQRAESANASMWG